MCLFDKAIQVKNILAQVQVAWLIFESFQNKREFFRSKKDKRSDEAMLNVMGVIPFLQLRGHF